MRVAILLEDGVEIFRGAPADLPVRFITADHKDFVEWTMAQAVDAGTPCDETGDLAIFDGEG